MSDIQSGSSPFIKSQKQLSSETLNRLFKQKLRAQFELLKLRRRLKNTEKWEKGYDGILSKYMSQKNLVKNISQRMDYEVAQNIDALNSLED